MTKTIISISDRETKKEIAHMELNLSVNEAKKHAYNIANELGFGNLLHYQVWCGSTEAYEKYLVM